MATDMNETRAEDVEPLLSNNADESSHDGGKPIRVQMKKIDTDDDDDDAVRSVV